MESKQKDKFLKNGSVLALGSFDGLHLGHMSILKKAKEEAAFRGLLPAVMLFDVHPKSVLNSLPPKLICSLEQTKKELQKLGFEVVVVPFLSICNLSPAEFFVFLQNNFNPKMICCGFNYHYGKNAAGTADTLQHDCNLHGVDLFAGKPVYFEEKVVSSTLIRNEISFGSIEKANKMLGRLFSVCGPVVHGDARGRTLGFPTANQKIEDGLVCPKYGVYASFVEIDGKRFPAATNIGIRPTIGGGILLSETHILNYSGDLYGKELEVFLLKFIRGEENCGSLEGLKAQLEADIQNAKQIFNEVKINGKA